jgi:peptidoglycan/LPS O-acetylase OafA/YrhL
MTQAQAPAARPRWFTLADGLARRRDNFLPLRFLAAALVIYGHGYALAVHAPQDVDLFTRLGWKNYSGAIGVDLFFVVSGFLVAGSWQRRRDLLAFAWARALRLLPAYAVCMVLSAFVLGALYTRLPLADYLRHPDTSGYVLKNLTFGTDLKWSLPGVFAGNPRRATLNGSIWTLPVEARMYLWLAAFGALGLLSRRWLATAAIAALLLVGWRLPEHVPLLPIASFLHLGAMFALGVLCHAHRDRLPASGLAAAALAGACWALHGSALYPVAFALAEAAFTFWFAYRLPLPDLERFGDASYGLYLWGYPMQQVVAHHLPALSPLANAALGLPLAAALGFLSWHLIEKPALAAKEWPQRLRLLRRPRGEAAQATSARPGP